MGGVWSDSACVGVFVCLECWFSYSTGDPPRFLCCCLSCAVPCDWCVQAFHRWFMAVGHAAAASYLIRSFTQLDETSMASVKGFYKRIWDLFYLEYAMYPFI